MDTNAARDAITPKPPTHVTGVAAATRTGVHAGLPAAGETGVHAGLPASGETGVHAGSPASTRSGRETMVSFLLAALLAGMVLFFLNFVSFGIFFYVMAAVVAITTIGFLHYVLWGYSLSEETSEEMHAEQMKRLRELEERM